VKEKKPPDIKYLGAFFFLVSSTQLSLRMDSPSLRTFNASQAVFFFVCHITSPRLIFFLYVQSLYFVIKYNVIVCF
jgi:hypothetical protein